MNTDDTTRTRSGGRRGTVLGAWIALLVLGLVAGCTFDFDRFQPRNTRPDSGTNGGSETDAGGDVSPTADASDTSVADTSNVDTTDRDTFDDTTPNGGSDARSDGTSDVRTDGGRDGGDASPDTDAPSVEIGTTCQSDGECPGMGTCFENYCTRSCSSDDDCPDGASCRSIGGEERCLLECPAEGDCPQPGGRPDLTCATFAETLRLGRATERDRSCLPDKDGDGVFDARDNCPDDANPTQRDRDADGTGDACDPKPRCHSAATDGRLDYRRQSHPPEKFSIPPVVTGNWMPVVGGARGISMPSSDYVALDREGRSWTNPGTLPYPAFAHEFASLSGANAYLSTPGRTDAKTVQSGRSLLFRRGEAPQPSIGLPFSLSSPRMATLPNGSLAVLGFEEDGNETKRRLLIYDPVERSVQTIGETTISDPSRWDVTRNQQGDVLFYERPKGGQSGVSFTGEVLVVRAGESPPLETYEVAYPDARGSSRGPFDPALVPGLGPGRIYILDRIRNRMGFMSLNSGSSPIQATAVASWELSVPFDALDVAVDPRSPSFILVGRSPQVSGAIRAIEFYPTCLAAFQQRNQDGDPEPDISDNCPTTKNRPQQDVDGDGIGDLCDDDADNDGIPNAQDVSSRGTTRKLDTDNDGEQNLGSDDDDDNDGIPDTRDRFPLDTDNDGTPNHIDPDDDDDGYSDTRERNADRDATDPIDFPGAGRVAFVRNVQGASRERTVDVGALPALDNSREIISKQQTPRAPAFYGDSGVVALAGNSGQTSTIVWKGAPGASVSTRDLGLDLRAVVPRKVGNQGSLNAVLVVKTRSAAGSAWELASRSLSNNTFETISDNFDDVRQLAIGAPDGRAAFVAGPSGCTPCRSLYDLQIDGGTPRLRVAPDEIPVEIGYDGTRFAVVSAPFSGGSVGTPTRLSVLEPGDDALVEVETPSFAAIDSAVPGPDGHLLVAARKQGSNFDLWLYNGLSEEWSLVLESPDSLEDVAWTQP